MPGEGTRHGPELCLLRGGGDLATGIAWRLTRAGWPVVVCELARPLTVRRTVAVSSAVGDGAIEVEGMRAELAPSPGAAVELAASGVVAVVVSAELPAVGADVVVDARLAKRNIDTTLADGSLVVGVGPGFTAGADCHAVVETQRGHHLGRVFWRGSAAPNTGTPGVVDGKGAERVLRAPSDGTIRWRTAIGDRVRSGDVLGTMPAGVTSGHDRHEIKAPFDGVIRGLISGQVQVTAGLKIGDVDPRCEPSACHEISDKALAVGGGVVEAVLSWSSR